MTREDAIEILQRMKYPYKCKRGRMLVSNVNEDNEALDMAIEALKYLEDLDYETDLERYIFGCH